jgi:glycogen debranching enzyme-like protein
VDDTALVILDGCTFMYSDSAGNVEAREAEGLFYQDVRHLSSWEVLVDGEPIEPLSSRRVDYYSARIVGGGEDVAVRRDRFVTEGMHEDVVVQNLSPEAREVRVEVRYGSDFADVMEAQQGGNGAGRSWHEARARSVTLWHERRGYRRGTALTFNRSGDVGGRRARFDLRLRPRESWHLCVDVTPIVEGRRRPPLLRCCNFQSTRPRWRSRSTSGWRRRRSSRPSTRPSNGRTGSRTSTSRPFASGRTTSPSGTRCPAAGCRGS